MNQFKLNESLQKQFFYLHEITGLKSSQSSGYGKCHGVPFLDKTLSLRAPILQVTLGRWTGPVHFCLKTCFKSRFEKHSEIPISIFLAHDCPMKGKERQRKEHV